MHLAIKFNSIVNTLQTNFSSSVCQFLHQFDCSYRPFCQKFSFLTMQRLLEKNSGNWRPPPTGTDESWARNPPRSSRKRPKKKLPASYDWRVWKHRDNIYVQFLHKVYQFCRIPIYNTLIQAHSNTSKEQWVMSRHTASPQLKTSRLGFKLPSPLSQNSSNTPSPSNLPKNYAQSSTQHKAFGIV